MWNHLAELLGGCATRSLPSTSSSLRQRRQHGDLGSKILFLSAGLGVLGEILPLAHSYFDIKMKSTLAVFLEEADLQCKKQCKSFTQVAR